MSVLNIHGISYPYDFHDLLTGHENHREKNRKSHAMQHYISNHFLRHFVRLTQQNNLDPIELLKAAGLSPKVVTLEYSVLPLKQFVTLLTHTRNQPRGKSIALLLAQQQDISVFGPLIPKLEACHNIQALLDVLQTYVQSIIPGLSISQQQHLDNYMVSFNHDDPNIIQNTAFCEYAVSFSFHVLQQIIEMPLSIRSIFFPTAEPSPSFIKHYQGLFHCSIAFNQTQLALCFHPDILSFKVYNIAQPLKTKISQQDPQSQHLGTKIEELISMGLASGNVNIDVIGHSLGLHPRKLQRLLAQESLSYSQILDSVRHQHARQYITRTQFDMTSIAYMLGYKNLATFSRECKKWFGMSPIKLRKMIKDIK